MQQLRKRLWAARLKAGSFMGHLAVSLVVIMVAVVIIVIVYRDPLPHPKKCLCGLSMTTQHRPTKTRLLLLFMPRQQRVKSANIDWWRRQTSI